MGMYIQDGTGSDRAAKVNKEFLLETFSVMNTGDQYINRKSGKVWSLEIDSISATGANDYIFYLKNNGDNALSISDIRLSSNTAGHFIQIQGVTGTAAGGTDISPVSRTIGSSATLDADAQSGSNITGLTEIGPVFEIAFPTANRMEHLRTSSRIRIEKGQAVALLAESNTPTFRGHISIIEEVIL